jgi:hypothetical protein
MYSSFYNFLTKLPIIGNLYKFNEKNVSLAVVDLSTLQCAEQDALGLHPKTPTGAELA